MINTFVQPAASEHGEKIDHAFDYNRDDRFAFLLTQVLFCPHTNVSIRRKENYLARIIINWNYGPLFPPFSLPYWWSDCINTASPEKLQKTPRVEVTGKQFNWMMRYPGKDGVQQKNYRLTDASNGNALGVDWEDGASR
jgi:cytochrome c oxidase subunit 2